MLGKLLRPHRSYRKLTDLLRRHCPQCKKDRKSVKKLSLSKLPPILVIHLKRFSFHGPFSDKVRSWQTSIGTV